MNTFLRDRFWLYYNVFFGVILTLMITFMWDTKDCPEKWITIAFEAVAAGMCFFNAWLYWRNKS